MSYERVTRGLSPYSRTRNRQLVRVLALIRLLSEGRWTWQGLSTELRVTTRTVRRDVAALEEAHLAVRWIRGTDGRRRITMQAAA